MRRTGLLLAIALAVPQAAMAQPGYAAAAYPQPGAAEPGFAEPGYGEGTTSLPGRWALRGGDTVWAEDAGLNAFFYPNGYDPQYGAEGRVADADDFAADYGCRPIWNVKYGRYTAACN